MLQHVALSNQLDDFSIILEMLAANCFNQNMVEIHPSITRGCQACGAMNATEIVYCRSGFPVQRCKICRLGSTVTPEGFDPSLIYSESYFNGRRPDGYSDYQGSQNVLSHEFLNVLNVLASAGVRGGKLLEIGCAYGFFLEVAKTGFEVAGIEVCQEAVKSCQSRGLPVKNEVANAANIFTYSPLDVVVMLDVIEHLTDPFHVVQAIYESLRPGGHLLFTTGDWGSLISRMMGKRWRLMTPPQHLFFFSRKSVLQMLRRVGFKSISISHPTKNVPLNLILYQATRILGLHPKKFPFFNRVGVPVNLFDAMRVVAVK